MSGRSRIERELRLALQEFAEATPEAEPKPQAPVWQFVGDFKQMAGEQVEPDPQFFIESWTLGVAAAMENLEKRRGSKMQRQADSFDSFSTQDWLERNALNSEFASAASGRPNGISQPQVKEKEPVQDCGRGDLGYGDRGECGVGWEEPKHVSGPMNVKLARRILGVGALSTRSQIKVAYRRMVSRWHPDRLQWATAEVRKLATEQMAMINEAYRLLHECW